MDTGDVTGGKEVTGDALTALTDSGEGEFRAGWETEEQTKRLVTLRMAARGNPLVKPHRPSMRVGGVTHVVRGADTFYGLLYVVSSGMKQSHA